MPQLSDVPPTLAPLSVAAQEHAAPASAAQADKADADCAAASELAAAEAPAQDTSAPSTATATGAAQHSFGAALAQHSQCINGHPAAAANLDADRSAVHSGAAVHTSAALAQHPSPLCGSPAAASVAALPLTDMPIEMAVDMHIDAAVAGGDYDAALWGFPGGPGLETPWDAGEGAFA